MAAINVVHATNSGVWPFWPVDKVSGLSETSPQIAPAARIQRLPDRGRIRMASAWLTPPSPDHSDSTARQNSSEVCDPPTAELIPPSHVSETVHSLMISGGSNASEGQNPLLSAITVAALELTEATGAALALKTEEGVVCLARAGETAPPLGTVLGTNSGISGECFRTGLAQHCPDVAVDSRVDAEASERLGVRSLAVVPLLEANSVVGILEVFSDHAGAFEESHITLLSQLAAIAFSTRKPASGAIVAVADDVPETSAEAVIPIPSIAERVLQEPAPETKPSRSVKLAVLAVALLALVVSFGWVAVRTLRGPASQRPANKTTAEAQVPNTSNPAGAVVPPSYTPAPGFSKQQFNATANSVVVRASNTHPLRQETTRQSIKSDDASRGPLKESPAAVAVDKNEVSKAFAELEKNSAQVSSSIVTPSVQMPVNTLPVSQGVTGGSLVRSVAPTYPETAKRQKIQGDVVLQAVVEVDGTVRDLTLVSGDPVLAGAARQAVTQWRYSPYLLNGKPVSMRTSITIRFTLPQ